MRPDSSDPSLAVTELGICLGALWVWVLPFGILIAGMVAYTFYFKRFKILNQKPLLFAAAVASIVVTVSYQVEVLGVLRAREAELLSWGTWLRFSALQLCAPFFICTAIIGVLNGAGDRSPVQLSDVRIMGQRMATGRSPVYFVEFDWEGTVVELLVPEAVFDGIGPDSTVLLETRPGGLGMTWVVRYEVRC